MQHYRLILFLLICLASFAGVKGQAPQSSVSGQVIDAATNRPMYYVNVFLANTTLGTTSDDRGRYTIQNIPPGNYTLVASHIGYEPGTQKLLITPDKNPIVNFALRPTVIELGPVQIDEARDRTWRKYFKVFEEEFLGYSPNAAACEFTNPAVLRLVEDDKTHDLLGRTIQPLELVHHNFGYKIKLIVRSFQVTDDQVTYNVLPVFEEMKAESPGQADEWQKNRENAYYGSYRHFFGALFFRKTQEAGFSVERVEEPKRFRPANAAYESRAAIDSLFSPTDYGLIFRVHFGNYLRIRYKENWAQTSFLQLPFDTMEVDLSGNALSEFQIVRSGFWGRTRFADELPLDYVPQ